MSLPAGYTARPATPDDLHDVYRVALACDLRDWGSAALEEQDIADDWGRSDYDLTRDTVVIATEAGEIVAYGGIMDNRAHLELEAWGAVDPGHQGRGLGTELLHRLEGVAGAHAVLAGGSTKLLIAVAATDRAAADLVRSHGFTPVRSWLHMEGELDPAAAGGPVPEGIRIEPFRAGHDERDAHRVSEEAMAEHWGYTPEPYEEWAKHRFDREGVDTTLWFLAREGDELVGVLVGGTRLEIGWVWDLGVLKRARGRGLGAALLRTVFAAMAGRGLKRVGLNVDAQNETRAAALYDRVGMRTVRRFDFSEKEIRPEVSPQPLTPRHISGDRPR